MGGVTNQAILAALLLSLLTACSSARNPQPAAGPSAKIEEKEQFRIKETVYGYLLQRDFLSEGVYSAVFLRESEAFVSALNRKFSNQVPAIKPSHRARLSLAGSPIDKDTGRPAMVLGAIVSETTGQSVEAIGTYYAGPMVSGKYVFNLRKVDGKWLIESVRNSKTMPPAGVKEGL